MKRNRVRIIGGVWRSRLIDFPAHLDLRPTPDRVRETLFNWLGQTLYGSSCLDLFAGSGVLGFEALSRGAERVVMVESERSICATIAESANRLGAQNLKLACTDALQFLLACAERYDVVFIDPPYRKQMLVPILEHLPPRLAAGARVYIESADALPLPSRWRLAKAGRAGKVRFGLIELTEP